MTNKSTIEQLLREVGRRTKVKFSTETSAKKLTTFSIGGQLNLFEPQTVVELQELILALITEGLSYNILGAGSNLLVQDAGISSPVIKLSTALGSEFNFMEQQEAGLIRVGAARSLMRLSREISRLGLVGLEFAGGIPASVGGAVRMNAGAHQGEMSQLIKSVTYLDSSAEAQTVEANQLDFAYRKTSLAKDALVIAVDLQLVHGDAVEIAEHQKSCLDYRKKTQPLQMPSAGSIFKNPGSELFAGKLIEDSGLKSLKKGFAEISSLHANWIVNPQKQASSQDVLDLIADIQDRILADYQIDLETELVCWDT